MADTKCDLCLLVTMTSDSITRLPLKSVDRSSYRFASHSTNPTSFTPCLLRAIISSPLANHHATMSLFHTNNDPTFCGEDQTTAWSEAVSNEQDALAFDWTATCPILVSGFLSGYESLFTF